jgi:hypothetical protein
MSVALAYSNTCLVVLISWLVAPIQKKKDKESFDDLNCCLVRDAEQQSERDFPRMSILNLITDGTKICRSEWVDNCFLLLWVMHTHSGKTLMLKETKERKITLERLFKNCLKLYLLFECWVNEPHPWSQVCQSSKALGNLIKLIKECFPRDVGWGWNLPKMHAFAKMPHKMSNLDRQIIFQAT